MSISFYQEIRTHPKFDIDFTKTGWRQFARLNRNLGSQFIRAFILKRELAAYISAHEARGIQFDMECLELRYDDGVCLTLKKIQGTWYITGVFASEPAIGFAPVFFWQQIKRGCNLLLAHVLIGWRVIAGRAKGLATNDE